MMTRRSIYRAVCFLALSLLCTVLVSAQDRSPDTEEQHPPQKPGASLPPEVPDAASPTMFPHPDDTRWWASGQMNFVFQTHPRFPAKYSGPNSLHDYYEKATSRVLTLYLGAELTRNTEILVDVEETGGRGVSDALGLAGFTNLDVVRNPDLGAQPYLARAMFHHVFALSADKLQAERSPLSLFTELPRRRLEVRFGKFSLPDFLDLNAIGSDSHSQFLNWTADNNGAWDYAADTRGYTVGALFDFEDRSWGVRLVEALMPTVANGIDYEWNLRRARGTNAEFELRKNFLPNRPGIFRILGYNNTANMGIYRVQNALYFEGLTPVPEISAHPPQVTGKYGFGFNFEQSLTKTVKSFGRFGWNNGKTESFAYTEVDQTVEFGAGIDGAQWKRRNDKAGAVFVSNAIKGDHQFYLAHGGLGFILGDGALNYGRETIFEAFYNAHLWKGIFAAIDVQHINNPGYNRDRGPVVVPGVRLHVEL